MRRPATAHYCNGSGATFLTTASPYHHSQQYGQEFFWWDIHVPLSNLKFPLPPKLMWFLDCCTIPASQASDFMVIISWVESCRIPMPMQISITVYQHSKSNMISHLALQTCLCPGLMSQLWWSTLQTSLLPAFTILVVCCSSTRSNSSSHLHPAFLPIHFSSSKQILLSGNLSFTAKESIWSLCMWLWLTTLTFFMGNQNTQLVTCVLSDKPCCAHTPTNLLSPVNVVIQVVHQMWHHYWFTCHFNVSTISVKILRAIASRKTDRYLCRGHLFTAFPFLSSGCIETYL